MQFQAISNRQRFIAPLAAVGLLALALLTPMAAAQEAEKNEEAEKELKSRRAKSIMFPSRDEYEMVILPGDAATRRDISAQELGNPKREDIPAMFRAADHYATTHGYGAGYPNFHTARRNGVLFYGLVLIERAFVKEVRGVTARELNNSVTFEHRLYAANQWAKKNGHAAAFPNGHLGRTGYGIVVLKDQMPGSSLGSRKYTWNKLLDGSDLFDGAWGPPDNLISRFQKMHVWAERNGHLSGFPSGGVLRGSDPNAFFYNVKVKTKDVKHAGTDGDVTIEFIGTAGTSEKIDLDSPGNYDDFERGDEDSYLRGSAEPIGVFHKIRVTLEEGESGWLPEWFEVQAYGNRNWQKRPRQFNEIAEPMEPIRFANVHGWLAEDNDGWNGAGKQSLTFILGDDLRKTLSKDDVSPPGGSTLYVPTGKITRIVITSEEANPHVTLGKESTVSLASTLTTGATTRTEFTTSLEQTLSAGDGAFAEATTTLGLSFTIGHEVSEEIAKQSEASAMISSIQSFSQTVPSRENEVAVILFEEEVAYKENPGKLKLDDRTIEFNERIEFIRPHVKRYKLGSPELKARVHELKKDYPLLVSDQAVKNFAN